MTADTQQTVLISLVGTAPAVLSETVWALATQDEPVIPDRVIALTTSTGASLLRQKLFDDGHWAQMLRDLEAKGLEIDGRLRFGPISDSIRVFPDSTRSRELDDIRTAEDNEAVAEFFMEVIRSFAENESTRLIVSIAGGRKTTSALLYAVMSLLGRADDRILHILVDDQWVFQPDFMYPGCRGDFVDRESREALSSADAELQLVETPFVPLRYLFQRDLQRSAGSFTALIQQVRNRTINVDEDLILQLHTDSGKVFVSGEEVNLSPNEFLLYLYFARRALESQPAVASYSVIGDDLEDLRNEFQREDDFSHWSGKALSSTLDPNEDLRKWASSIRAKLRKIGLQGFQVDRLVPRGGHLAIDLPRENIIIET